MSISFDILSYFDEPRRRRGREWDDLSLRGDAVLVFDYPKLDRLQSEDLAQLKHAITMRMTHAKGKLLSGVYARELAEIDLVEAAQKLREADTAENRESFLHLNELVFGKYRLGLFRGVVDGTYLGDLDMDLLGNLGRVARRRYKGILAAIPKTSDDMYYDAVAVVAIANKAFTGEGLAEAGWRAELNADKFLPTDDATNKLLHIPLDTRRNAKELRRLLVHEIGVHSRRAQNGEETGCEVLKVGTAGYLAAEEGLAILMECAVEGTYDNSGLERAMERYLVAGYALGADGGKPRTAAQTYVASWPEVAKIVARSDADGAGVIEEAKTRTYRHVENAFRGTNLRMAGVIFMQLKVYYEGFWDNLRYFGEAEDLGEALEVALLGKYNHTSKKEATAVASLVC